MIIYEPQPKWLRDIVRLPLSYALRRAMLGTLMIAAYAALCVWLLDTKGQLVFPHGAAAFGLLGGALSLTLAFRLNNAYARWWEARYHLGLLVNHSRNLAALVHSFWAPEDDAGRARMGGLIGNFSVGLSRHLRGELEVEHLEALTAEERDAAARRDHLPLFVAHLILKEIDARRGDGRLDVSQIIQLQPHARAFVDVVGACERIRSTPIPFAATSVIRLFLLLFTASVPVGLHREFGWYAVPVSMLIFFILAAMDAIASELENPFGIDCNDLPTRFIGETIRRQVHSLLGIERVGEPDQQPQKPELYEKVR